MEKHQQYMQHNSSDLCNKTGHNRLLGALFVILAYRKGVYCRAYEPYVDQD